MDNRPERATGGGHSSTGRPEHLSGPAGPTRPDSQPQDRPGYQVRVERVDVCPNCTAPRACCHCAADVAGLRRFATRMAMIHQRTGTPLCGCGAHSCYVRIRLDDIAHTTTSHGHGHGHGHGHPG